MIRSTVKISIIIPLSIAVFANLSAVTAEEIAAKLDDLYRSQSSMGKVEMTITTPEWQRTLVFEIWTLGMEKTFVKIVSPEREKDFATLRIGNEMWNYLPATNRVMKIPPSMMLSSWMGSDFTNDDLVRESSYIEDYTFQIVKVENPVQGEIYLEMIPKETSAVVWGKIITAVREGDFLPLWQKYYDEDGNFMREMVFTEIVNFGSREIPSTMEIRPLDKPGNSTVVRFIDIEFDTDIDEGIFSLRNLQRN
ncbi:outer membrane lipoprotein-sorting protein [candidate division WOR-3 bacterium]|nr:outer membrane lipoprotein-sorting protein [candidate division WOR-3 bacterium]